MGNRSSQPWLHQHGRQVQQFGTVRQFPLGLSYEARTDSCQRLNHVLADSQILYALYKKHHWLMRGPTFYQLHLLLDKHACAQLALIDSLAERVQTLGGVAVGDPRHVAEITCVPRPPDGAEEIPAMLSRLLEACETILIHAHDDAARAREAASAELRPRFPSAPSSRRPRSAPSVCHASPSSPGTRPAPGVSVSPELHGITRSPGWVYLPNLRHRAAHAAYHHRPGKPL